MSKKRKGPAQSGPPQKRPIGPVSPESVPYIVENLKPTRLTQERLGAATGQSIKGQSQNSLETAPGSHKEHSKVIAKVDLCKSPKKLLKKQDPNY